MIQGSKESHLCTAHRPGLTHSKSPLLASLPTKPAQRPHTLKVGCRALSWFTASTLHSLAALALVSYDLTSYGRSFLDACWRCSPIMVWCNVSLTSVSPPEQYFYDWQGEASRSGKLLTDWQVWKAGWHTVLEQGAKGGRVDLMDLKWPYLGYKMSTLRVPQSLVGWKKEEERMLIWDSGRGSLTNRMIGCQVSDPGGICVSPYRVRLFRP